jgi:hypothetical protein
MTRLPNFALTLTGGLGSYHLLAIGGPPAA